MRVAILGNSGSGKTTLARRLAERAGVDCLDLDTVAWEPGSAALARPDELACAAVAEFCSSHSRWIVEGCYANLIDAALRFHPRLVFLNPGERACLDNCMARPWEPHKYGSKFEQDARLAALLDWVSGYYTRDGPLSLSGHRACFDRYRGPKREIGKLADATPAADAGLLAWLG